MSENVISIHGREPSALAGKPNPELIEKLEKALADAKAGKMQAFGLVGLDGNRAFMIDLAIDGYLGTELLGGVHLLAHRLTAICEHGE